MQAMNVPSDFKPVITKATLALQKQNKPSEFKALVFVETQPKQQEADTNSNVIKHSKHAIGTKLDDKNSPPEFDIKKARHEVLNFCINNQRQAKNAKKMQQFQAAKMGMKVPKKPYKNYKVLLEERKRLQNIREQRKKFHQLGKNQTGAASVKCRSKTKLEKQSKKRAPVSNINQHYGVAKPKLKKNK